MSIHLDNLPPAPGIVSMLQGFPATGKCLTDLAQQLLVDRASDTFTKAERETIATLASSENKCIFCTNSHAAVADECWQKQGQTMNYIEEFNRTYFNEHQTPLVITNIAIPTRLLHYMLIAKNVHRRCQDDMATYIEMAQKEGATDADVHDVVLIVSAFRMYNLYVDTLAQIVPHTNSPMYQQMGQKLAKEGYRTNSPDTTK